MSIGLMDTTIFCNVIGVPDYSQNRDEVLADLERHISDGVSLLLPMAAVLETGNHIANAGADGRVKRSAAERFRENVLKAVEGTVPWTPTPFWDLENLKDWLSDFPDHAMRGIGMGDLSIIKEWERQCELHPGRRVFIWSRDGDLHGYDRERTVG